MILDVRVKFVSGPCLARYEVEILKKWWVFKWWERADYFPLFNSSDASLRQARNFEKHIRENMEFY